jgi:hypothetical protein
MKSTWVLTGGAVALLCAAPAIAQTQQKEEKAAPAQVQSEPSQDGKKRVQQKDQGPPQKGSGTAQRNAEPKQKSTKGEEPKEKATKGTAQGEPPERPSKIQGSKGTAQKGVKEEKPSQGRAQAQPKDQGAKGSEQAQPKEQSTKGAATKDSGTKGTATDPGKGQEAPPKLSDTAKGPSGGSHLQLSEQQRTNVHDMILKESHVNRVTNVNFTINVGVRVPREVRLAALPASVITIVPEYRSHRYFIVDEEICIVDPVTYEIVEIITVPGRSAARVENRGGSVSLVLTDEEKAIILHGINLSGASTLGLGALTEGADVPRGVEVRSFPDSIVQKVPKVKRYKFFAAENRIAIVDPRGAKIQLVIEGQR